MPTNIAQAMHPIQSAVRFKSTATAIVNVCPIQS